MFRSEHGTAQIGVLVGEFGVGERVIGISLAGIAYGLVAVPRPVKHGDDRAPLTGEDSFHIRVGQHRHPLLYRVEQRVPQCLRLEGAQPHGA